jgi:hypothetical protein
VGSGGRTPRPKERRPRLQVESLEDRVVPSTIVWANESTDTTFAAVYGTNAARARAIIHQAMSTWEGVIANFNYANVGQPGWAPVANRYELNISARDLTGFTAGLTTNINYDPAGKPFRATIAMDDAGGGAGAWYFDPVPNDNAEFTSLVNRFMAKGSVDEDFYSIALHEMGHAFGFDSVSGLINSRVTNPGLDAPNDMVRVFHFLDGTTATLTTQGGGYHTFLGVPGYPDHSGDLMNPGRTAGERALISDLDARILGDAYGYSIAMPSTRQTFLANYNATTRVLTVNGDALTVNNGTPQQLNDVITIDKVTTMTGDAVRVNVDGVVATFLLGNLSAINVQANGGDDTINVENTFAGIPVTVNAGTGSNTINISPTTRNLDNIQGGVIIDGGGAGSDRLFVYDQATASPHTYGLSPSTLSRTGSATIIYNNLATLQLNAGDTATSNDTINVQSTPATTSVTINAGAGNDTVNVESTTNFGLTINTGLGSDTINVSLTLHDLDNIQGSLTLDGGSADTGYDQLNVNDQANTAVQTYGVNAFVLTRSGAPAITYSGFEALTLNTSSKGDTINVNDTRTTLTVNAGSLDDTVNVERLSNSAGLFLNTGLGSDTVNISPTARNLDNLTGSITINPGGSADTGTDWLVINDQANAAVQTYSINPHLVSRGVPIYFDFLESLVINTGGNNNVINVVGTPDASPVTINAGGGNDTVNVEHVRGPGLTVNGGGGSDTLNVSPQAGNLDNIESGIAFYGGTDAGYDRLNIFDLAHAAGPTYGIHPLFVSRSGAGSVTYGDVENLVLATGSGGSGSNTIAIYGTAAGTVTTVNGGSSTDTFSIDSNGVAAGGTVNTVVSALTLNGGGGTNTLTLEDSGDTTADTVTVTPTQVGAAAGNNFFGAGGSLTYSGLNAITMNMGSGADTVNLTPSGTTQFSVNAGSPAAPTLPGDSLNLTLAGAAGASLAMSGPGAGQWTFTNRLPVSFTGVESLSPASDLSWSGGGITGPATVFARTPFTISRNYNISGLAVSGNFTIGYYASVDAVFGNADDVLLGIETISAAADKAVGNHTGTSPSLQFTSPGTYYLFAKVDNGNAITETNEANNVAQAPQRVVVPNRPPVLAPIADRTVSSSRQVITVPLSATDPDGDPVTFTAAAQSLAYVLTLPTTGTGALTYVSVWDNYGGRGEKWLQAAGGQWYFIVATGELYQWDGGAGASGTLLGNVGASYYADPTRLSSPPANQPHATLSLSGSTLTITRDPAWVSAVVVTVTASDGRGGTDGKTFTVTVTPNRPPVLAPVADRTVPRSQQVITVPLSATDPDGDPVTFTAAAQSLAYVLTQQTGALTYASVWDNYGGRGEKWLQAGGGQWYFILATGELFQWDGGAGASGTLLGNVGASYYADPTRLSSPPANQPHATLSLSGSALTITRDVTWVSALEITVTADDGLASDSKTFRVIVTS